MIDTANIEAEGIRKIFSRAVEIGKGNAANGIHAAYVEYFEKFNAARNQRIVSTNPATPVSQPVERPAWWSSRQEARVL